jgi:hypothetical protein
MREGVDQALGSGLEEDKGARDLPAVRGEVHGGDVRWSINIIHTTYNTHLQLHPTNKLRKQLTASKTPHLHDLSPSSTRYV